MYSIGEFSKITGINKRTLIWYDNIGLLKAEKINLENGYRYYSENNVEEFLNISFLQSMGFTIKEIMNLTKQEIESKIINLRAKIHYIESNISFLEKIKEEFMEENTNKVFSILKNNLKDIKGKWAYFATSQDFNKILDYFSSYNFENGINKVDETMPRFIFFGENNLTDLYNIFNYDNKNIFLLNKELNYFFLNDQELLIITEKIKQKTLFHVYVRINNTNYTIDDLNKLIEMYNWINTLQKCPLPQHLIGKWTLTGEIKYNDIKDFNGILEKEIKQNSYSPLFQTITITQDGIAKILEDGVEHIVNKKYGKVYTSENTKMPVTTFEQNKFTLHNPVINRPHRGSYCKINNEEFMFLDTYGFYNLNAKYCVYKKA